MTLDGTNTWVLRAPGEPTCVVVDPGPDHGAHLDAVVAAGPLSAILLTHSHPDHSDGARTLHERTGAPVAAIEGAFRMGSLGLRPGDVLEMAGVEIRVIATPGHTSDSVSFLLPADGPHTAAVLTGDTVLGRGSTVVAHPDGRLDDYLASLRRLADLGAATVLPGHGPELHDLGRVATAYLAHRVQRLDQIRAALDLSGTTAATALPADVVAVVYADVDRALWPAAEQSVRAQLDYLRADGRTPSAT
jgi:glyoxylase-like metal-dependent hydrolase (beta-lactamase superfamily II)